MTSRVAFTLLLLCSGAAATAAAQGKPPKGETSFAASVTFNCPAGTTCPPLGAPSVDGQDYITGDGQPFTGGSLGASFSMRIEAPGRAVWLTLPQPLAGSRECDVPGVLASCNPARAEGFLFGNTTALSPIEIIVRPLDAETKEVSAGGLTGMACGVDQLALVSFTTWIDGTEGHWGLNFNPRDMYHSTGATVRRTSKNTWLAFAVGGALPTRQHAELVSFNHSGIRRKAGPSHEGQFVAPFSFTITADGVTTGPGCS